MMSIKLLLDTSFLIDIAELGRDMIRMLEEQMNVIFDPIIIEEVFDELKKLSKSKGKKAMRAKYALNMVSNYKIVKCELKEEMSVDDKIVELALKNGWAVATNDVELRGKLRRKGVPHIYMRHDGKVVFEGEELAAFYRR